jgi:hypothetical protein
MLPAAWMERREAPRNPGNPPDLEALQQTTDAPASDTIEPALSVDDGQADYH